jgi:hypothetical protein
MEEFPKLIFKDFSGLARGRLLNIYNVAGSGQTNCYHTKTLPIALLNLPEKPLHWSPYLILDKISIWSLVFLVGRRIFLLT